MEHFGSLWTNFHAVCCLRIFLKSVEKMQVFLKSDKNNKFFIWRPMYLHIWHLAEFLVEWEMFQNTVVEKIKIQFLFRKLCHLWDNVEKYGTAEQGQMTTLCRTDAISVPDNWGKNRTPRLRICNTYCFSTATTDARMHLRITQYVHHLSCFCLHILAAELLGYLFPINSEFHILFQSWTRILSLYFPSHECWCQDIVFSINNSCRS